MSLTLHPHDLAYHAATLALRADSTTTTTSTPTSTSSSDSSTGRPPIYKIIGIILAVASGLFIGVSFVLKKVGLLRANTKYNEEAGEGYGYLRNLYWWGGMTLMVIGEICNFVAYAFTDAILVTPLGALSVVITTILSAIFLKERLSFVGKLGCAICILGSVIIPLNAPDQSAVADIQEMQRYVIAPGFLSYAGVVCLGSAFTAWWVAPRYGKRSMLVYLSICSLVGGLSVVCTQGLGSAILAQINGEPQFNRWFTYVLLVFVIGTLLTEIIYLNKALNIFNAALVTPTYYVYFTSATILTSIILFRGFHGTPTQIVNVVLGFLTICAGVVLLQLAKSAKDVPDTDVLKGDLDQVRTVAEQEEPESEPRADTIRGGAGIVRALSRVRSRRQMEEARRMREEFDGEWKEGGEWERDGLRRRKTTSTVSEGAGSVRRRRTTGHPPLGMSRVPMPLPEEREEGQERDDDLSDADSEVHPGFFGRIARASRRSRQPPRPRTYPPTHEGGDVAAAAGAGAGGAPVPLGSLRSARMDGLHDDDDADDDDDDDGDDGAGHRRHVYGLPPGLRRHQHDSDGNGTEHGEVDTAYRGASSGPHIHFAGEAAAPAPARRGNESAWGRAASHADPTTAADVSASASASAVPPRPPPHAHAGKRQFSFQNLLVRLRGENGGGGGGGGGGSDAPGVEDRDRPTSSRGGGGGGALSFVSRGSSLVRGVGSGGGGGGGAGYPAGRNTTEEERLGLVSRDTSGQREGEEGVGEGYVYSGRPSGVAEEVEREEMEEEAMGFEELGRREGSLYAGPRGGGGGRRRGSSSESGSWVLPSGSPGGRRRRRSSSPEFVGTGSGVAGYGPLGGHHDDGDADGFGGGAGGGWDAGYGDRGGTRRGLRDPFGRRWSEEEEGAGEDAESVYSRSLRSRPSDRRGEGGGGAFV